jgi:hypothetical protein
VASQGPKSRKEELSKIFDMVYMQEFAQSDVAQSLKQAFEDESSSNLIHALDSFKTHKDYSRLRNEISTVFNDLQQNDVRQERQRQEHFGTFHESIAWYTGQHLLSQSEGRDLLQLYQEKNKTLLAIWEAHEVLKDRMDHLDSLKVLLKIRE